MKIINSLKSKDDIATKYLQKTTDSYMIETGYFNLDEHIICLSTQIGCPMHCIFCANAPLNFIRNLTSEEIVRQGENVLKNIVYKKSDPRKILFSYMGMGEPFLNYQNVIKSIKILAKRYPNSRTTVSTLGLNAKLIKKLADEKFSNVVKLHLSLHAPNDQLREKILPQVGKINPALNALKYFAEKTKASPKINYVLIKSLNDSQEHAIELAKLLKSYPFIVKLTLLNEISNLQPPPEEKFKMFEQILNKGGIKNVRFKADGKDIKSACGQLRGYHSKER